MVLDRSLFVLGLHVLGSLHLFLVLFGWLAFFFLFWNSSGSVGLAEPLWFYRISSVFLGQHMRVGIMETSLILVGCAS
jgi:hypothetical protein